MVKSLCCVALLMMFSVSYADIYRWVDSSGTVHFSDTPRPGAKKITLPEVQTFSAPTPRTSAQSDDSERAQSSSNHEYQEVAIVSPRNNDTIRDNQGRVEVKVDIKPKLFPGDTVLLLVDGQAFGDPQPVNQFRIAGLNRGSRTISVQIMDEQGNVITSSQPITIFMMPPRVNMGGGN